MRSSALGLLLLCLLPACAGNQTRLFSLEVENLCDVPVTVWLTKLGGPLEEAWMAPEDLAVASAMRAQPDAAAPLGGVVIPPGRVAAVNKVTGRFDPDARAVLRVYVGAEKTEQVLAIGRGSPFRADVPIRDGLNRMKVSQQGGVVKIEQQ